MGQGDTVSYDNLVKKIAVAANWVIRIVGSVIFLGLTWYAFRYTQYMNPGGEEIPLNVHDSMLSNLLYLGGAGILLLGMFVLEKKIPERMQKIISLSMLAAVVIWALGFGFWWITAVDRVPQGDQAFIYGGASYFLEGEFFYFERGGYIDIYPHQLSLIFLVELLFLIVGTYNYFAFQVICVILSAGIIGLGYLLVKQLTGRVLMTAGYCVLTGLCLPLFFYTGWVYGDVPSVFFLLLAANLLVAYEKKGCLGYLAGLVVAVVMAVLVRQNSLIFLIALCLTGGVHVLLKRDKKLALALVSAVLGLVIVNAGISKMYELRSGVEHPEGLPAYCHIAMGLQENDGKYGWYSEYTKKTYYSVDCVSEYAAHLSKEDISARLKYMVENPDYAWTFFREKILSQWNEPLYQSLFFSSQYAEGKAPAADSLVARISGEYFVGVLGVCDGLQFIIYAGILCYFVFAVKKDSSILEHLLAVGIIGGFFFSMMWEAKARYILPYYLVMFPLAVAGYWNLYCQAAAMINRFRGREDKDNIIEFKRAA